MTKREIANLCCRVLAIYALLQAVTVMGYLLSFLAQMFSTGYMMGDGIWKGIGMQVLLSAVGPVAMTVFAIVLWCKSGVVAAWIAGHDLQDEQHEPDTVRTKATSREIHMIVFSAIGLWILAEAIPALASYLAYLASAQVNPSAPSSSESVVRSMGGGLIQHVFRLIIGLYLLFGASGLVGLLRAARDFGLTKTERPGYAKPDDADSV